MRVADPDGAGRLMEVEVERDGDFGYAELPPLAVWQLLLVETRSAARRSGPRKRGVGGVGVSTPPGCMTIRS
ncbi:MAG: hypothetical protein IPK28_07920 [Devosia sp.]|nr:hypothetical protein [Devosia sp.]